MFVFYFYILSIVLRENDGYINYLYFLVVKVIIIMVRMSSFFNLFDFCVYLFLFLRVLESRY